MTKVLIVDDSLPIRNMIRDHLETQDYVVEEATNGKDALAKATIFQPDVILMDVLMPVMDGLEACRLMREDPNTRSAFIIMLTATKSIEDRVAGFDNGADDYLPKPFATEELFARIRRGHRIMNERRSALFDPLTDLFNRRSFESFFDKEASRSTRSGQPMALIMCDLDHFKEVNDHYGHGVGDQVLVTMADIIRRNLRRSDMPCRWGGEEFAMLLPETTLEDATAKAQKIRRDVEECSFCKNVHITASFGVASFLPDEDLLPLQHRADQALYQAKDEGRNKVVQG